MNLRFGDLIYSIFLQFVVLSILALTLWYLPYDEPQRDFLLNIKVFFFVYLFFIDQYFPKRAKWPLRNHEE